MTRPLTVLMPLRRALPTWIAAGTLLAATGWIPVSAAAPDTDARRFAEHVLSLRAAGAAGAPETADFLATLPGSRTVPREALAVLWSPVFANAMVSFGRIGSPQPVALFYDPLLDTALVTHWVREDGGYRIVRGRAVPGVRLGDPGADVSLLPSWMTADGGPAENLAVMTAARLGVFGWQHPADAREAEPALTTFAADAAGFRSLLPRLTWNALRREQWTDGSQPWLRPTTEAAEVALGTRDAAALVAAAPDTDPDTASVLAGLPGDFAASLVLDMWLEAEGGDRLLIGSLPEDGDMYVFILCRLKERACGLRRFMLLSLTG